MQKEQSLGVLRHIMTFIGGFFVTKGYIDENMAIEGAGVVTAIAGLLWSYIAPEKKKNNNNW